MIRRLLIIIICALNYFNCYSQDIGNEMLKLSGKYSGSLNPIKLKVNYVLYENSNMKRKIEELSGVLACYKDFNYLKIGKYEQFSNGKLIVGLIDEVKTIFLTNYRKNQASKFDQITFKELFKEQKFKIVYKYSNGDYCLRTENTAENIDSLDLYFNSKNNKLTKLIIYYVNNVSNGELSYGKESKGSCLSILFSELQSIDKNSAIFNISNFIKFENGFYSPADRYRGYEFINNFKL